MKQLTEYEGKSLEKLGQSIHEGKWTNDGLVQLIELAGEYLGLKTIPQASRNSGKSYNGIKKTKELISIFGVKFIIENE